MKTDDGHIIQRCPNGELEAYGFLVDKYKESVMPLPIQNLAIFMMLSCYKGSFHKSLPETPQFKAMG